MDWSLPQVMHRMVDKSVGILVGKSRWGAVSLDVRRISAAAARARINIPPNNAGMVIQPSNKWDYQTPSSVSQCSPSKARGSQWRRQLRNHPDRDDAGAIPPRSRV